jgi:hypothetical protein
LADKSFIVGSVAANAVGALFIFENLESGPYFMILLAFSHGLSHPLFHEQSQMWPSISRTGTLTKGLAAIGGIALVWYLNFPSIVRAGKVVAELNNTHQFTAATGLSVLAKKICITNIWKNYFPKN